MVTQQAISTKVIGVIKATSMTVISITVTSITAISIKGISIIKATSTNRSATLTNKRNSVAAVLLPTKPLPLPFSPSKLDDTDR